MIALRRLKNSGLSWACIGERVGVSGTVAWKVCRGIYSNDDVHRYFGVMAPVAEFNPTTHHPRRNPRPREDGYTYAAKLDSFWREQIQEARELTGMDNAAIVKWAIREMRKKGLY